MFEQRICWQKARTRPKGSKVVGRGLPRAFSQDPADRALSRGPWGGWPAGTPTGQVPLLTRALSLCSLWSGQESVSPWGAALTRGLGKAHGKWNWKRSLLLCRAFLKSVHDKESWEGSLRGGLGYSDEGTAWDALSPVSETLAPLPVPASCHRCDTLTVMMVQMLGRDGPCGRPDPTGAPGSWPQPRPALLGVGLWEVSQ